MTDYQIKRTFGIAGATFLECHKADFDTLGKTTATFAQLLDCEVDQIQEYLDAWYSVVKKNRNEHNQQIRRQRILLRNAPQLARMFPSYNIIATQGDHNAIGTYSTDTLVVVIRKRSSLHYINGNFVFVKGSKIHEISQCEWIREQDIAVENNLHTGYLIEGTCVESGTIRQAEKIYHNRQ